MAKFLILDKKHYDPATGLIPLKRGDDWVLQGVVTEKKGSYTAPVDLTGGAATAFFDDGAGGSVTATVTFTDAAQGVVEVELDELTTPTVGVAEQGSSMYLVFSDTDGVTTTIETQDQPLEIKDRGFEQF